MTVELRAQEALVALYSAMQALSKSCASRDLVIQLRQVINDAEVELDLRDE